MTDRFDNLVNAYFETRMELRRSVHLIRHGEKNPSTAAVDPNQLTENGRRDALAYGARLQTVPTLDVYCSTDAEGRAIDRSHDTGWYIHAGYAGLEYDAANALFRSDSAERKQFVPELEKLLQQHVPQRILDEYKAKKITRAEAMEQCYKMLATGTENVDPAERDVVLSAAKLYKSALFSHLALKSLDQTSSHVHTTVLVGHDPNIGCVQQALQQDASLEEVAPLKGIICTKYDFLPKNLPLVFLINFLKTCSGYSDLEVAKTFMMRHRYSFSSAGNNYEGALSPYLGIY